MTLSTLFRSAALGGALLVGALATPDPVAAQSNDLATTQAPAPVTMDGPRITTAGVSNVVATTHLTSAPIAPQDNFSGNGRNVAMMVAGGAAIVIGGIVGGDGGTIIAVTGAVVGLIGLFRYLQ